jgi:D-alanyl-D-alanine carboxypeptidase
MQRGRVPWAVVVYGWPMARFVTHGFALVVISLALANALGSGRAADVRTASDAESAPTRLLLAQAALDTAAPLGVGDQRSAAPPSVTPMAALPSRTTLGADQQQATIKFDPRLGLPRWLRAIADVPMWSAADGSATAPAALPAGNTYVKPLGPFVDTRVQVYFPGDGAHPAEQAWVDTSAVEPSDIPPWIAPSAGTPSSLPAAPRRVGDAPVPDTTAIHIAILDDDSGQLLYGEDASARVPQASTTKIGTTIVALERAPDLSRRIRVTVSASAMVARDGSSTMGIEPGRTVSLDTLLHGMMLPSGNDAAEQVALALADSREQYVGWMNDEAAALGLKDTHFVNPSGMDAAGHYSSAYDMAVLARYAMRNATFRDLASASRYTGDGFPMQNLNRLLDLYPGADGVKIGFTDAAQKTIVASATRDGHRVFVSLMHSQDLVGDCTALFDWVWDNFAW